MRRYYPAFDIWQIPPYMRGNIQPGQWVYAGDRSNMGRFLGSNGRTDVVAWHGNMRAHKGRINSYLRSLRDYALSLH